MSERQFYECDCGARYRNLDALYVNFPIPQPAAASSAPEQTEREVMPHTVPGNTGSNIDQPLSAFESAGASSAPDAAPTLAERVQAAIYAALGCTRVNYKRPEQLAEAAKQIAAFVLPEISPASATDAAQREALLLAELKESPCPGGGYTGQPDDEYPSVENCLKAGECGCSAGAAVRAALRDAPSPSGKE